MTEIRGPTYEQLAGLASAKIQPHSQPGIAPSPQQPQQLPQGEERFERIFEKALDRGAGVKFSRHAQERISSRGIQITPHEMERLEHGFDLAAEKGGKDSLIVSGPLSYVVNVPSRTVVTALYGEQMKGNVFTKIDSAVVL